YATEILPALPATIYNVRAGNYAFLSRVMPLFVFDRTMAVGMYNSVLCAEDADFRAQDVDVSGVRPELADTAEQDAAAFLENCQIWGVPEVDAPLDAPVNSSIPTLVLNGRFDPITPPVNGEHVAASLSHATNVVFGYSGHGALGSGSCPNTIVRDFLRNPLQTPDLECVAQQPSPAFLTPSSVVFTHLPGRILDAFEGKNSMPVVLAVICLLPLLTLFVVWPIAWLVRILSKPTASAGRSGLLRFARWTAVIAALAGLAFALGITVMVLQAASSGNDIVLLFGVPAGWNWLLLLPWLMGICVVVMIATMVVGWMQRKWPAWEGVYYTLLTLAATVTAAGMILLII
ncbi:MAG TPA: alpha/beta hydrolase, partial [Roseiflexaceae bacterium]|nr:alpha/beta hydrolase [Roseiflexaceae bacterium]